MRRKIGIAAFFLLLSLECAVGQTSTNSQATVLGVYHNGLPNPTTPPTVQAVCSGTTVSYTYKYAAADAAGGLTAGSNANTGVNGCTTLSLTSFNIISTPLIAGASTCYVWRVGPSGIGKVGSVPCGGAILDNSASLDGSAPPNGNTTGSVNAAGTVTAQNFLATNGTNAGTSDWVTGSALSSCSTTPPPCIQPSSFFIAANSGLPATPFGWLSPTVQNTANNVLIVGNPTGIASVLSYGSLTDSSSATPVIATANGSSFSNNHLVSTNSSGVDLADSGIAMGVVTSPTDSLTITPGTTTSPTVIVAATGADSNVNLGHLTKGTGAHIFQPSTDSTQMFQLRTSVGAGGLPFASFDSSGKQFRIGDNTAPAQTLDVKGVFQVNSNGIPVKENGQNLTGVGLSGIVYNSASSATNAGIALTPFFTAPATSSETCGPANTTCYRISFYAFLTAVGSGCGNTNISAQINFRDPSAGAANSVTVAAFFIAGNGTLNTPISPATGGSGLTLAVGATGGYVFRSIASGSIQYSTAVNTTCSSAPQYIIVPILEQL